VALSQIGNVSRFCDVLRLEGAALVLACVRLVHLCVAGDCAGTGMLALVFGWLIFRSRVSGVYLSIITRAMR